MTLGGAWVRFTVLMAFLAALTAGTGGAAFARSYWLENGSQVPAVCPGASDGRMLKVANGGSERFLITALVNCTDTGASYRLRFEFLSVRFNPDTSFYSMNRPVVEFDWVGLAVYKPADPHEERIEWLYDEVRMIEGSLARNSSETVYFSDLEFDVPKDAADEATHFTFYLTWKGPLETFGVL